MFTWPDSGAHVGQDQIGNLDKGYVKHMKEEEKFNVTLCHSARRRKKFNVTLTMCNLVLIRPHPGPQTLGPREHPIKKSLYLGKCLPLNSPIPCKLNALKWILYRSDSAV